MEKTIASKLAKIQQELVCQKNQTNKFGGYKFRSCEDILEAVKTHLQEQGLILLLSDEMIDVGGRVYVKATASVTDGEHSVSVAANAREAVEQKGMMDAQLTGATSSYARKYALNGLFCIDDTKDADATNQHGKEPLLTFDEILEKFNSSKTIFELDARKKKYVKDINNCSKKEIDDLANLYKFNKESFDKEIK